THLVAGRSGAAKSFPAERTYRNRRNAASCNCFSHTPPGGVQPAGFLNKCRDPRIDELRLDGLSSPLANYAQPRYLLRAILT
ncbi:MAG TPA: hypothetical protein PLY87_02930, partial [Planctomycetaceae bacterium]|nr:hypothetical protein [Planctomycetaceae bacterium]